MGPPSLMRNCVAAMGTAQAVFLRRSKLGKLHRFLESLARGAVTPGLEVIVRDYRNLIGWPC
jgi:hypothetical protein